MKTVDDNVNNKYRLWRICLEGTCSYNQIAMGRRPTPLDKSKNVNQHSSKTILSHATHK